MGTYSIENNIIISNLIDSIPEGLCILRRLSVHPYVEFIAWNRQMEKLTGYTINEVNLLTLKNILLTSQEETILSRVDDKIHEDTVEFETELEIKRKDSNKRIISVNISKIITEDGISNLLISGRDVTERRRTEMQLKEIQERYEKILEISTEGVIIHNNGEIVYANERTVKQFGFNQSAEVVGRSVMDFIHNDFQQIVNERVSKIYETGESQPPIEEKIIAADGNIIDVEVATTCVPYEGKKCTFALIRNINDRKRLENALKNSESLLRKVTENTIDMISIIGIDGKTKYFTPSHYTTLGYCQDDLKNVNIFDLIHPEDLYYTKNILINLIKTSGQTKFQCRFKCWDNSYKHLEVYAKLLRNQNSASEFIFSSRDFTERLEMEKALVNSEKKYRNLFNNINDAIYVHKFDESGIPTKFTEVNDAACSRAGLTREQLTNMTVLDISPNMDSKKASQVVKEIKEKGSSLHEALAVTKNSCNMPVEVNSILLSVDNEDYILSLSRDISKRKEIENALRESEERYRLLIESLPYGVYIVKDNIILFCNKIGLNYLGAASLNEAKGKKYSDFLLVQDSLKTEIRDSLKNTNYAEYFSIIENKYTRISDNAVFQLEAVARRFPYAEHTDALLVITKDISDRKRVEILEKDMKEKVKQLYEAIEYEKLRTEFFANISHELRTPVNVIFSTLQLLGFTNNNNDSSGIYQKYKKHMAVMKQNCYRLIRLINNLIDVTKIDSGFFQLNLSNNNIVSVVEEIVMSVSEYIENKGISLIFDTEIEEKELACDPDIIERIVLNLVSNALKFTEPGGNIFVNIFDKGDKILISVKDTGIGISKDKQNSIFERFVQVDKSMTRNREGSGIGLSLVKSLVEMHYGTISVHSEPGHGSEFLIELPVCLVEDTKVKIESHKYNLQRKIEKVNIEFSDIYL